MSFALADFHHSVDLLQRVHHVYRDVFTALSYCGMGEHAYRRGAYDAAVEHHTAARELVEQSPDKLGMGYLLVRSSLGLAKAFRRLRMRHEEDAHFAAAAELFTRRQAYNFQVVTEGSEIRAWVDFAMYHAAVGQRDESIKWLRKAVVSGWRDSALVTTDEDLGALGGHPEFVALRRKLEQGPAVAPELANLLRELQAGAV